jgi:hypothetical protein
VVGDQTKNYNIGICFFSAKKERAIKDQEQRLVVWESG